MATPPRIFEEEVFYHVYNRGNRKQQIFLQNRDYDRFLQKAAEYKEKFNVKIIAYCLMPNHFHFLIQQFTPGSISRFFSNLCNSHSKFFNTKYETVGSVFQGRFKAKAVKKDEYLVHLSRYIHLNPVGLFDFLGEKAIDHLSTYRWSSFPMYLSGRGDGFVDPLFVLSYFQKDAPTKDYKNFVAANITLKQDPEINHLTFDE